MINPRSSRIGRPSGSENYPADYDGRYAAFGRIADDESLAVLDAIAAQPTDSTYLPLIRQVVQSIRVDTFGVDYGEPETVERG